MKLSNNSCSTIDITSSYLDDVLLNPGNYEKIEIKATVNCCDTEYLDTITVTGSTTSIIWSAHFPVNLTLTIKKVTLRNVTTGQLILITLTPVVITSLISFNSVVTQINSYITTHYGGSFTLTQSSSQGDDYSFGLYGFKTSFVPVFVDYTLDGIAATSSFSSANSLKGSYITGTGISIVPDFFDLEAFTDAVYSIEVSTFKPSGSRVKESNCLFLDCKTSCVLTEALKDFTDDVKLQALMMHYGLTVGTNCACECNMLCDLYTQLHSLLYPTETTDSCGCN